MSYRQARLASVAAAALTVSLAGCVPGADSTRLDNMQAGAPGSSAVSTPSSSVLLPTAAQGAVAGIDFAPLLLRAGDLSDADDTFALRETKQDPNGLLGASALFVNQDDTRAVSVTIAGYPNAAVATATLHHAVDTAGTVVTGGTPGPLPVGTDGTIIRGRAPDGGKAVTLALFTQGPVLARLEFDSANGDPTTDRFVTDIAKMQQIALRVGIPAESQ